MQIAMKAVQQVEGIYLCNPSFCAVTFCKLWYQIVKGGAQKKGFHPGLIMWVSYFGLWVARPHDFPCCIGWVPLPFQKALGFLFPPKSYLRFTPILPTFSYFFCNLYPNFGSFYASGVIFTPIFALFIL